MDALREPLAVEQAERLAQLELRNHIIFIGLLVWAALLLGWLLFCYIKWIRSCRNASAMQTESLSFTCETCGASFSLPAAYLLKHPFIPRKSVTVGMPGVSATVKLARKLPCPACRKKAWCLQDMAESRQVEKRALREGGKAVLPQFLIVSLALFVLGGVFFSIVQAIFR